ncbi:MAG: hypothetical protein ACKVOO_04390 [Burkholderiaceae bacterium]
MSRDTSPELLRLKNALIDSMTNYMQFGGADGEDDPEFDADFDAGYVQEDIDQCAVILDTYFDAVANAPEDEREEAIMEAVKTAVLELNALNEQSDGGLIETDQREQLCDLIILAASEAGLETGGQDITEEWREW